MPDGADALQGADVEADLLAEVVLVLQEVERPLVEVHNRREGQHAREEVRVRKERDRVRHHPRHLAGRRHRVPRVGVEGVAARHGHVRRARCDAAGRGRVQLGMRLVEHYGAAIESGISVLEFGVLGRGDPLLVSGLEPGDRRLGIKLKSKTMERKD